MSVPQIRRLVLIPGLILLLFAQGGCDTSVEQPLRIGSNRWPGYEPLYLARSLGFYENSAIRLVELPSATEVIHALRTHSLEGAALTLDETLTVLESNLDLQIILVLDISRGGDAVVANSVIPDIEHLRGAKIAVENTAVGAIMLDAVLTRAGLRDTDVEIIQSNIDEQEEAFISGRVNAVVTFEPVKSRLLAAGAHVIYDSSKIPDRIIDVLVVRRDILKAQPKTVLKLLKGYFQALTHIELDPDDSGRRMASRLGVPAEEVMDLYAGLYIPGEEGNRKFFENDSRLMTDAIRNLHTFMLKNNLLAHPVRLQHTANGHYLEQLTQ